MGTAYVDAAGRTPPDFTEVGAGEIGGLTLPGGLYKWGTDLLISTDVTLQGGPDDVWIFQVAGNLEPGQRDGGDPGRRRIVEEYLLAGRWFCNYWNDRAL